MRLPTVLAVLITILVLSVLVAGIVLSYFWLKRAANKSQAKAFSRLEIFTEPRPGTVAVVFHTYFGFLVYFTQTEYRFWANPENTRTALWRLH